MSFPPCGDAGFQRNKGEQKICPSSPATATQGWNRAMRAGASRYADLHERCFSGVLLVKIIPLPLKPPRQVEKRRTKTMLRRKAVIDFRHPLSATLVSARRPYRCNYPVC